MVAIPTGNKLSGAAAADFSSAFGLAGYVNSAGAIALPTTLGQFCNGIVQEACTSGRQTALQISEASPCIYGGTVAIGDELVADTDGQLVARTLRSQARLGYALTAGTDGQAGGVQLAPAPGAAADTMLIWEGLLSDLDATGNAIASLIMSRAGRITGFFAVCTVATTDVNGSIVANLEIGGVDVTGGVLTLAFGAMTRGAVVQATAITALNTVAVGSLVDFEVSAATAYDDGRVAIYIVLD